MRLLWYIAALWAMGAGAAEAADLERIRASHEPSTIFLEDWFIKHVLLNPQVTGAIRSLLGKNVGLPVLVSHHRSQCPSQAQGWHQDADHIFGPELRFLEVFYFPQDTPIELGPTELVPGSHIQRTSREADEAGVFCAGPAGTIGIHHQSILHRRGQSSATGLRRHLSSTRSTAPAELIPLTSRRARRFLNSEGKCSFA